MSKEIEITESDLLLLTRVANALENANKTVKSEANKYLVVDLRELINEFKEKLN